MGIKFLLLGNKVGLLKEKRDQGRSIRVEQLLVPRSNIAKSHSLQYV